MDPSVDEDGITGVCPLLYPLGPIMLYYLTIKHQAIMIHGSGIFDGNVGRIFSGFSGVGKSTMAAIWKQSGSTVINDDRLIIRKTDHGYEIHNTPMFYVDYPKKAALNKIYFPFHFQINTINKLKASKTVSKLLAFSIHHGYNPDYIKHHLNFLTEMALGIPSHELGFVPNPEIVGFLKNHD